MAGRGGGGGRKILVPPINYLFKLLQDKARVVVWLFDQHGIKLEGNLKGFDEFMNIVLEETDEITLETDTTQESRRPIGRMMLKGDNVSVIHQLQ